MTGMQGEARRPRVGLFVTCLVDLFRPTVGFAAVALLEKAGCDVEVPAAQTCCGQPAYNSGDRKDTRAIAKQVIDAFASYQAKGAWTWEHLALTRARVIGGDKRLMARARKEIATALAGKRDLKKTRADILEMRAMIEAEKGGEGAWDLKQAQGGLVDVEFVAQYLELIHGVDHPALISTETDIVLSAAAKAGLLPAREAEILVPALRLYQAVTQLLRLCVDGLFRPADAPQGLLDLLARAGELPDFASLDRHVRDTEAAVRASFERIIGKVPPADGGAR